MQEMQLWGALRLLKHNMDLFLITKQHDTASLHRFYGSGVLASHARPLLSDERTSLNLPQLHQEGLAHDDQDSKLKKPTKGV